MLALARREALRRQWIGALLELADLRIERLAYTEALEPLDRILSVDPTNEAAVGRLMRVLFWLDRRDEALRAYRGLTLALSRSYQTPPLRKVRLLSGSIRAGVQMGASPLQGQAGSSEEQSRSIEIRQLVGREKETGMLAHWMTTLEHLTYLRLRKGTKPALITDPDARSIERCLLFVGEKGIGKTRLAQEAASLARARGWLTVEIQAHDDHEYLTEYSLWTRLLRRLPIRTRITQEELQSRPLMLHSLKRILPEFDAPHVIYSSPLAPIQEQLRLWEAIARLLALMAQKGPLFLVLDDLHYADVSSCALLAYLARRWLGVFVVGTCQREGLPATHPLSSWVRPPLQQHIKVFQLSPISMQATCTLISGQQKGLSETAIQAVSMRSAGNPYFALQLAQALSSTYEQIQNDPPRLMRALNGPLPDTITDMFKDSLHRLEKEIQHLLAKAALIGPTFTFEQLYTLETRTTKTDEVWLFHALEEAVEAGLLRETWSGTQTTYSFWHPLFAEYLSRRISAERRTQLQHQIIALLSSL